MTCPDMIALYRARWPILVIGTDCETCPRPRFDQVECKECFAYDFCKAYTQEVFPCYLERKETP